MLPPNVCSRGAITPKSDVSTSRGSSPRAARTWGKPAPRGDGVQRTERALLAGRAGVGWGCWRDRGDCRQEARTRETADQRKAASTESAPSRRVRWHELGGVRVAENQQRLLLARDQPRREAHSACRAGVVRRPEQRARRRASGALRRRASSGHAPTGGFACIHLVLRLFTTRSSSAAMPLKCGFGTMPRKSRCGGSCALGSKEFGFGAKWRCSARASSTSTLRRPNSSWKSTVHITPCRLAAGRTGGVTAGSAKRAFGSCGSRQSWCSQPQRARELALQALAEAVASCASAPSCLLAALLSFSWQGS